MPSMAVRCCCSRVRGAGVDGTEVSVAASVSFSGIRPELIDGLVMVPLWLRATIAQSLSASQISVSALDAGRFLRYSNLKALTNPVKFRELNRLIYATHCKGEVEVG